MARIESTPIQLLAMDRPAVERQKLIEAVSALPDETLLELANFLDYLRYKAVHQKESASGTAEQWQYLLARPHPWRKQLYIRGRKLLASTVWQDLVTNQMSLEEAAENWDLTLSAIDEVIRYCESHQELLKSEADEERYRLEAKGVTFESTTAA